MSAAKHGRRTSTTLKQIEIQAVQRRHKQHIHVPGQSLVYTYIPEPHSTWIDLSYNNIQEKERGRESDKNNVCRAVVESFYQGRGVTCCSWGCSLFVSQLWKTNPNNKLLAASSSHETSRIRHLRRWWTGRIINDNDSIH